METHDGYRLIALEDDGVVPNNARLPLILYEGLLEGGEETALRFERLLGDHRWRASWRYGVFPYHHYHATAHEALGCFRGEARIQFGGPSGPVVPFRAGEAVAIPAGVGHKNCGSSDDFCVVGGYPEGQSPDMNYARADERKRALRAIGRVPLPEADPFFGPEGPLLRHWAAAD